LIHASNLQLADTLYVADPMERQELMPPWIEKTSLTTRAKVCAKRRVEPALMQLLHFTLVSEKN
jgi:hypothetical protein